MFLVDFGSEQVLVEGYSEQEALRTGWLDIIYQNCENGERSVEQFRAELDEVSKDERESFLRSYTTSLRNFGYKWADFKVKGIKSITEDTWAALSDTYRVARW